MHLKHHEQKTHRVNHDLYVVTMVSNPKRFASRYRLYEGFRKHMLETPGVSFHPVEVAFGERPYELGDDCIRFRGRSEVWLKEAALNAAIARLPEDAKYIAWIDADVRFVRDDWAIEAVHALQHFDVIQPWSTALDLDPNHEVFGSYTSFCAGYRRSRGDYAAGGQTPATAADDASPLGAYYGGGGYHGKPRYGHPGYAWAARREALDHLGGLMDFAVAGAGDHHMAAALVGLGRETAPSNVTPQYLDHIMRWQHRAERYIRRNIGYSNGTITHAFHGPKQSKTAGGRGYIDRWRILTRNAFNPDTDLKRDAHGLIQLVDNGTARSRRLRDDLSQYFNSRNEDDIRVD